MHARRAAPADRGELSGISGYNNAILALNEVAEQYKNSTLAKSARSITVDDVNKLEGETPNGSVTSGIFQNDYGMNANLDIVSSSEAIQGKIETETIDAETEETVMVTLKSGNLYSSTAETGYYSYSLNSSNFLTGGSLWLASRTVSANDEECYFNIRLLKNLQMQSHPNGAGSAMVKVYNDEIFEGSSICHVLPVVSLKSGIQMEKDGNNVWQLSVIQ